VTAAHHALQRALVIALHDEGFVAAMHADPEGVLGPLGVGARERAQLLGVDRRAFRTDPLRRRRLLRVLSEEIKVAATLALWETRRVAFLEGFFASPTFRTAVATRAPLAPAFGEFLGAAGLRTPQLGDVARLETLTARCRRARHAAPRPGVALAPGVATAAFDGGVLDTIQAVERFLFELGLMPQLGLCADGPGLPPLPPPGGATLHLLLAPSSTGVALTPIDEDLHRVLCALAEPVTDVARALAPCGVPASQAAHLVASLAEDGLVTSAPAAT
jgi:hypothetical protein